MSAGSHSPWSTHIFWWRPCTLPAYTEPLSSRKSASFTGSHKQRKWKVPERPEPCSAPSGNFASSFSQLQGRARPLHAGWVWGNREFCSWRPREARPSRGEARCADLPAWPLSQAEISSGAPRPSEAEAPGRALEPGFHRGAAGLNPAGSTFLDDEKGFQCLL